IRRRAWTGTGEYIGGPGRAGHRHSPAIRSVATGAVAGMGYDVAVVRGGSAGCVVAARISADERRDVLLVEAGLDYPRVADLPPDIADESMPAMSHDWGLVSDPDES